MEPKQIKFKYIFADDYNPIYVNGAHGGLNSQGEIIAHFYLERVGLPNYQTAEITPEGKLGSVIDSDPQDLNQSYIRFVRNGVIMNLQTAKSIHQWLGDHIANLEKLQAINSENKSEV